MKKLLLILCAWLMLSAASCTTTDKLVIPDGQMLVQKVRIDPRLLVDCDPELAELKGNELIDALNALAASKKIHDVCYKRLHELIQVTKFAFPTAASGVPNTKEESNAGATSPRKE